MSSIAHIRQCDGITLTIPSQKQLSPLFSPNLHDKIAKKKKFISGSLSSQTHVYHTTELKELGIALDTIY